MKKNFMYLCAFRGLSEKTGKMESDVYAFGDKKERDDFAKICKKHGVEFAISEGPIPKEHLKSKTR